MSAPDVRHRACTMVICGICHEEGLREIGELDSCDHGYTAVLCYAFAVHICTSGMPLLTCGLAAVFVLHASSSGLKLSPSARSVKPDLQPSAARLWTWNGFLTVMVIQMTLCSRDFQGLCWTQRRCQNTIRCVMQSTAAWENHQAQACNQLGTFPFESILQPTGVKHVLMSRMIACHFLACVCMSLTPDP